jgi:hypothetical protein
MTAPRLQQTPRFDDESRFFSHDVPSLLDQDPRAALELLDAAEQHSLPKHRILTARILAFIALREARGAYDSYRSYLDACRAAGGFGVEPPFDALRLFFEDVNERAWAAEVREVAAMECNELFNRVLTGERAELTEVSATLDTQLETAPETGPQVARTCALKACVLSKLGQKAEALKFWKRAKDAAPDVAEFWKQNSLLA